MLTCHSRDCQQHADCHGDASYPFDHKLFTSLPVDDQLDSSCRIMTDTKSNFLTCTYVNLSNSNSEYNILVIVPFLTVRLKTKIKNLITVKYFVEVQILKVLPECEYFYGETIHKSIKACDKSVIMAAVKRHLSVYNQDLIFSFIILLLAHFREFVSGISFNILVQRFSMFYTQDLMYAKSTQK